jgi:hypothetical protein
MAAARNKCFIPTAGDEANGPVYLIAVSFVDYFLIHYKSDLHAFGELGCVDRFRAKFPARQILFPARAN